MEIHLAGRMLLWHTTAIVGGRNLSQNVHQNIANDWMNNAVFASRDMPGKQIVDQLQQC